MDAEGNAFETTNIFTASENITINVFGYGLERIAKLGISFAFATCTGQHHPFTFILFKKTFGGGVGCGRLYSGKQ